MLDSIVTSKARVKILLKFFLNPEVRAYLREISDEMASSTNAVRVELNRLVNSKLLKTERSGRSIYYSANIDHPLYPEIQSISRKMTGIDRIHSYFEEIGSIKSAYISGDYARGVDSGIINLILVGEVDCERVAGLVSKMEKMIGRKVSFLILTDIEFAVMRGKFSNGEHLLRLWG